MIAQLGHGWKVEKSAERITSFAGLPLLTELAHQSKLIKDLDAVPGSWERHGRYATSDYVLSLALPKGWEKFEIKNLRFRLLCRAAKLVRHAGQTVLKLSRGYAHFEVFERARWAVLSPLAAGCG